MKILLYISTIGGGGAARVLVNLANYLVKANYQVIFITNFSDENEYLLDEKIKRLSLEKTESTQNRLFKNISRIYKLRRLIRQEKPQVSLSFMGENNFRLLLSTFGLASKTIISVRNDPKQEYKGVMGYLVGKFLFRLADGVVFQTKEAQAWFPKSIQKKSTVIFNAVQDSFYRTNRSPHPQHIITCGRLNLQKNHALLIRAFARIASKYPQENLLIYGKGILEDKLHLLISKLHLEKRVYLMGLNTNIEQVLAQGKIFVLSSDFEGLPNALMEALALGVPSISTDCPCGGPRELIKQQENGLLVPCNNEEALAQALEKLLLNPQKTAKMGEKARRAARIFRPELIFKQWQEFIFREKV